MGIHFKENKTEKILKIKTSNNLWANTIIVFTILFLFFFIELYLTQIV